MNEIGISLLAGAILAVTFIAAFIGGVAIGIYYERNENKGVRRGK